MVVVAEWVRHWDPPGVPLQVMHYEGQKLYYVVLSAFLLFSDTTTFGIFLNIEPLDFVTERMLENGSNKVKHLEKEYPKYQPRASPGQQLRPQHSPTEMTHPHLLLKSLMSIAERSQCLLFYHHRHASGQAKKGLGFISLEPSHFHILRLCGVTVGP